MLPKVSSVDQDDSRGRGSVDTSFYRVSVRVLVLKCRCTRLNSEVIYSGKDSYPKGTKRSRRSNQKYLARKMFQQKNLGFVKFKV